MLGLVLAVSLASFPLPSVDGKPLSVTPEQKSFRLPMRFEKVRAFYEEQLKSHTEVVVRSEGVAGERKLSIINKSKHDTWVRALITEKATETVVDVTPVIVIDAIDVQGQSGPLVVFVLNRSPEVKKALDSIDHTDDMHH